MVAVVGAEVMTVTKTKMTAMIAMEVATGTAMKTKR
jgi:hypothetical protein